MKKIITPIFSLAMVLTMAYSCKKAVAYDDLPEVNTATDTTLANVNKVSQQFQQVFTVVHTEVSNVEDQAFKTGGNTYPFNPNAVTTKEMDSVLVDGKYEKFAKKVTIDFPYAFKDTKYLDHTYYGTIVVTKTGRIDKKGTICTIDISNFIMDNHLIEGALVLENQGFVNGVYNLKLDLTSKGRYHYMQKVELHHTLAVSVTNKIYKVALSGTQVFSYGSLQTVTSTITSPLIFSSDCNYIKQGATKVTTNYLGGEFEQNTITDYGDGTCDNKSTVVVGEITCKYNW